MVVGKIGRLKQNHKTPVENRGFYAACWWTDEPGVWWKYWMHGTYFALLLQKKIVCAVDCPYAMKIP